MIAASRRLVFGDCQTSPRHPHLAASRSPLVRSHSVTASCMQSNSHFTENRLYHSISFTIHASTTHFKQSTILCRIDRWMYNDPSDLYGQHCMCYGLLSRWVTSQSPASANGSARLNTPRFSVRERDSTLNDKPEREPLRSEPAARCGTGRVVGNLCGIRLNLSKLGGGDGRLRRRSENEITARRVLGHAQGKRQGGGRT